MTAVILLTLLALVCTANGVDLPPTITAGTSSYPDYNVPAGGTTLDVPTMLANAPAGGPTFVAPRLVFDGTLTIALPTTAAAWPGVPLTVTIVDGKSSAGSVPSPHLEVSGVLAVGSKITLLGGVYEYSNRFIIVPAAGLTLQDLSSLLIESGTYRELCPSGGGFTYFLLISGNLTLNTGSTLSYSRNTFSILNVNTAGGNWGRHTVYAASPVTLDGGSTFAITDNTMTVDNVVSSNYWLWYTFLAVASSPVTVSAFSRLNISNNPLTITNVAATTGAIEWYTMFTYDTAPVTVSTSGVVAVTDNAMSASGVTTGSVWKWYVFSTDGNVAVSGGGTFNVSGNRMAASSVDIGTAVYWYVLYLAPTTATTVAGAGSTFAINHNTMDAYRLTTGTLWLWYVLYGNTNFPIALSSGATLSVAYNAMTSKYITVGQYLRIFTMVTGNPVTVAGGSALSVAGNSVSVVDTRVTQYWLLYTVYAAPGSAITLTGASMVSVSSNIVCIMNVSVTWDLVWYGVYLDTNAPLSLSDGSIFNISGNNMVLSNTTVSGSIFFYKLLTLENSNISLYNSSTLSVAYNVFRAYDGVVIGAHFRIAKMYFKSALSIEVMSQVAVSGNNYTVMETSTVNHLLVYVVYSHLSSPISVIGGSTMSVSENAFCLQSTSIGWDFLWYGLLAYTPSSNVNITTSSILSLSNNNVSAAVGVTSSTMSISVLKVDTAISVFGVVSIRSNTLLGKTGAQVNQFEVSSDIGGLGQIVLEHNNVGNSGGLLVSLPGGTAINPEVVTCENIVNSVVCVMRGNGPYGCSVATTNFVGGLKDCTSATPTATSTLLTTMTPSTRQTPSSTAIPTMTTPHTLSPKSTSSQTLYPTLTNANPRIKTATSTRSDKTETSTAPLQMATTPTITPSIVVTSAQLRSKTIAVTKSTTQMPAPPNTTTTTATTSNTTTTTPVTTLPPSSSLPSCNYSCTDVISLQRLQGSSSPQQAMLDYITTTYSLPTTNQGCTPLRIPYITTSNGGVAHILAHILAPLNTTFPLPASLTTTSLSSPSAVSVVLIASSNFTISGDSSSSMVLILELRRGTSTDDSPSASQPIQASSLLPTGLVPCTPQPSSSSSPISGGGIPWANFQLEAPPTILNQGERAVVAVVASAMASADLQTVAAIGLLSMLSWIR